jgi:hypothetical protein
MSFSINYLSDCTPLYTTLGAPGRVTSITPRPLNRSVQLTWDPPNQSDNTIIVDSYIIRYKLTGAPLSQTLGQVVSFFTTAIVEGLSNGVSYELWIIAKNRFGESPFSPTITITPGAPPSPCQIVRRAYHSTTPGNGIGDDTTNAQQRVGLEFTPPITNNGSLPIQYTIKYTLLGRPNNDISYTITDAFQTFQTFIDASNAPAITTTGVKGNYIRKDFIPPLTSPSFISGNYRFEVITNNLYGFSSVSDLSFVIYLSSSIDANANTPPTIPRITSPSFSSSSSVNGDIVGIVLNDSSFRFQWKQYRDPVAPTTTNYSGWSYRIQYTDDKDYWYYPPIAGGDPNTEKYPEYTRAYDTTSAGANTADFQYFIDISRNVVNGRRYYVRYCVVNAQGDTSQYTQITYANLSITSVIPGKLPQPPPIFNAAVGDRLVRLYFNWYGPPNHNQPPSSDLTGGLPVLDYRIERYIIIRADGVISVSSQPDAVFDNIAPPYYEDAFEIRVNGIEYLYRIYTRTAIGLSTLFTSVSAIPSRKSDIVYNVSSAVNDSQITLYWNPPVNLDPGTPIVQYYIEYREFRIKNISDIPAGNIVGTFSNQNTISNTIQDMNSILVNDALWNQIQSKEYLATDVLSLFTNSANLSYTVSGLQNGNIYIFRVAAVTQDRARRNIVGLINVIGNNSPYLPRPSIIGSVPRRITGVEYIVGSENITIKWSSSNVLNTENIIHFIVDYRVYGSGSAYLRQTFEYANAITFTNGVNIVLFSVVVSNLGNNILSRPATDTDSYEMIIYSENPVGFSNPVDWVYLHNDLPFSDIYENITGIPRRVRPAAVPSLVAEVRD